MAQGQAAPLTILQLVAESVKTSLEFPPVTLPLPAPLTLPAYHEKQYPQHPNHRFQPESQNGWRRPWRRSST